MAPSGGGAVGLLAPLALRVMRKALQKASQALQQRLGNLSRPSNHELQPVLARTSRSQPLHPLARIRQAQGRGRWYSSQRQIQSTVCRYISTVGRATTRADGGSSRRLAHGSSFKTIAAVAGWTARAPFASALRPNVTAGAFPRSVGGYSLGSAGGARSFSHAPATPAQVLSNVSAACRAFWVSGQRAEFHGVDNQTGEKQYRTVSFLKDEACRRLPSLPRHTAGSSVDFALTPRPTALSSLNAISSLYNINTASNSAATTPYSEGFLDAVSVDFAHALKDLTAIVADLKRLATLGDLPVSVRNDSTLRVHFPGCDGDSVEQLCSEVGVRRGLVRQDEDFLAQVGGEVALKFPFASTAEHDDELSVSSPRKSVRAHTGVDQLTSFLDDGEYLSEFDYEHLLGLEGDVTSPIESYNPTQLSTTCDPRVYEGVEGIYRFLEQCDSARRPFL